MLCEEVAEDVGTCRRYVGLLKLGSLLGAMLKSASGHAVASKKREAGETCSSNGLLEMWLGGREKFSEPKRRTFHAGERTTNG